MKNKTITIPDIDTIQTITKKNIRVLIDDNCQKMSLKDIVELKQNREKEKYLNALIKKISKEIKHAAKDGQYYTFVKQYKFDSNCPFTLGQIGDRLKEIFGSQGYKLSVDHIGETIFYYDYLLVTIDWRENRTGGF